MMTMKKKNNFLHGYPFFFLWGLPTLFGRTFSIFLGLVLKIVFARIKTTLLNISIMINLIILFYMVVSLVPLLCWIVRMEGFFLMYIYIQIYVYIYLMRNQSILDEDDDEDGK
jgi:Ca2+/Na+ antiporter